MPFYPPPYRKNSSDNVGGTGRYYGHQGNSNNSGYRNSDRDRFGGNSHNSRYDRDRSPPSYSSNSRYPDHNRRSSKDNSRKHRKRRDSEGSGGSHKSGGKRGGDYSEVSSEGLSEPEAGEIKSDSESKSGKSGGRPGATPSKSGGQQRGGANSNSTKGSRRYRKRSSSISEGEVSSDNDEDSKKKGSYRRTPSDKAPLDNSREVSRDKGRSDSLSNNHANKVHLPLQLFPPSPEKSHARVVVPSTAEDEIQSDEDHNDKTASPPAKRLKADENEGSDDSAG